MPDSSTPLVYDVQSFHARKDGAIVLVDVVTEGGVQMTFRMGTVMALREAHEVEDLARPWRNRTEGASER